MRDQIYHEELRQCIDHYGIGFNATESQVEIQLLKKLFTEESARMFLLLRHELEPVEVIPTRAGMDPDAAETLLHEMTRKGVTFPIKKDGVQYYSAAPFLHGIYENYPTTNADSDDFREVAGLFKQYIENGWLPTGPSIRTVPIHQGVAEAEKKKVAPFENVKEIVEGKEKIGILPCACTLQERATQETPCHQKLHVCMAFDFYAEYVIEGIGQGHWIIKEEALEILRQAEQDGLVHQISGDGAHVEAICNCCHICCTSLRIVKLFPVPGELVLNNFLVTLDTKACINCELCMKRCPMAAFSEGEDHINLNRDRCIGCGLCTTTCPGQALQLHSKPKEKRADIFPPGTYNFMRTSQEFAMDIARYQKP